MGIFNFKKKGNGKIKERPLAGGIIFNFINIDSINGKSMDDYYWEFDKKKKGLFAGRVENVYLAPGEYNIVAHGNTYQTSPKKINVLIENGENYILGAGNCGLYFEPY